MLLSSDCYFFFICAMNQILIIHNLGFILNSIAYACFGFMVERKMQSFCTVRHISSP